MIVLSPRAGILGFGTIVLGLVIWAGTASDRNRELGRYVCGFALFAVFRNLADDINSRVYYSYVIDWEKALFGGLPGIELQRRFLVPGHWSLLDISVVAVYLSYFLVPPIVLVLLWSYWSERLRPYVSATVIMFGVSLVIHVLVPTAPPWLASIHRELPPVHQVVRLVFGEYAPATYHYGEGLSGNAVAAMPSVHLAVTTLIACALWPTRLRAAAVAYVGLMAFAVVYGGEHYAVDGVAGVGLGLLAWAMARGLGKFRTQARATTRGIQAAEPVLTSSSRASR